MDDTMSDSTKTPNTDLLLQPFGDKPDAGPMVRCMHGPTSGWLRSGGNQHLAVRQADSINHAACHQRGWTRIPKKSKLDAGRSSVDRENERAWLRSIHIVAIRSIHTSRRGALGGTGGGSFATTCGIGLQKAIRLGSDHVFRCRVNATYGFFSPVAVQGFNTYGGGFGTEGCLSLDR